MDPKVAVQHFYNLIEAAMANGLFKKIEDLDGYRSAQLALYKFLHQPEKDDSNQETGKP